MSGYLLSEGPERIEVECPICDRFGSYARDRLIEKFGDIALPELKDKLVKCRWSGDITHMGGCGARFARSTTAALRQLAGLK